MGTKQTKPPSLSSSHELLSLQARADFGTNGTRLERRTCLTCGKRRILSLFWGYHTSSLTKGFIAPLFD